MINCIIFDLGNVVVKNLENRMCRRLAPYSLLGQQEINARYIDKGIYNRMQLGGIGKKELFRISVRQLKLKNISRKRFERIFADIFTANLPVQRLIRKLAGKYKLVLLSNTSALHFEHINRKFPILKAFSGFVLSYKVHAMKPGLKIYRIAVKKSGFKPGECAYIDDKKLNAVAAKKAGLHGLHYTTTAKLKSDLKRLGVKF